MPRRSAYTLAPTRLAQLADRPRADLHAHTTASDGQYTPSQVVALARAANLRAVAITDHDTLAGVAEAQTAAGTALELVPGVEISTSFAGREFHLLAYFVRTDHAELNATLEAACAARRERFRAVVGLLRDRGVPIPNDRADIVERSSVSLGRRHAAALVLACGAASTQAEAIHRYVNRVIGDAPMKALAPIAGAIELVHDAGGVTSLAHPPDVLTDEHFAQLKGFGLDALEVAYPWGRRSPTARLREVAGRFGFAVSGGSDCHGPGPRAVGSCSVTWDELTALRDRAARAPCRSAPGCA